MASILVTACSTAPQARWATVEFTRDELSFANGEVEGSISLQVDYVSDEGVIRFNPAADVLGTGASIVLGGKEFSLSGQSHDMAVEWLKVPGNVALLTRRLENVEELAACRMDSEDMFFGSRAGRR